MNAKHSDVQALRCADCARSDSAVTDLAPSQHLPIPVEALAGELDRVPDARGINRRQLLRGGLAGIAGVYSTKLLRAADMWDAALAQAAEPMQKSLECIFLNGGNDSLNTIVPLEASQFSAYTAARANIARAQGTSTGTQVGTT